MKGRQDPFRSDWSVKRMVEFHFFHISIYLFTMQTFVSLFVKKKKEKKRKTRAHELSFLFFIFSFILFFLRESKKD